MTRFLVDEMLGRLAVWLRILGYDTAYSKGVSDTALLERALSEDRVVLTRNTRLLKRRKARNALLVFDDHWPRQLAQVVAEYKLESRKYLLSRCLRCNRPLLPAEKPALRNNIPPYVFATQQNFSVCPRCKRVYWPATHVTRLLEKLGEIL